MEKLVSSQFKSKDSIFVDSREGREDITWRVINGTYYHIDTPEQVVSWLETSMARNQRIRVFYGDTNTGADWLEENDTMGTIGRSTGKIKIPILIKRSTSTGGLSVLDHAIVKITTGKHTVYQHPKYHLPELTVHADGGHHWVMADKKYHARFITKSQANRFISFLKGERDSK